MTKKKFLFSFNKLKPAFVQKKKLTHRVSITFTRISLVTLVTFRISEHIAGALLKFYWKLPETILKGEKWKEHAPLAKVGWKEIHPESTKVAGNDKFIEREDSLTSHEQWHPPRQLRNALMPKQAGLVRTFFTEWQLDLDHCSFLKSPHKSSLFSRERISKLPEGVSLFVGR